MTWSFPDLLQRVTALADELRDLGVEYRIQVAEADGKKGRLTLMSNDFPMAPSEEI